MPGQQESATVDVSDRPKPPARWRTWCLNAVALGGYLATRYYLRRCFKPHLSDVGTYLPMALKGMDLGQVPYVDFLVMYPPIAWWLIAVPRIFDPCRYTAAFLDPPWFFAPFHTYAHAFRRIMLRFDMVAAVLFLAIAMRRRPALAPLAMLLYTACTAILGHLLLDRLDIAMLAFILLWAYLWLSADFPTGRSRPRHLAAWLVLGLSISLKGIPVLMVPYLLGHDLRRGWRWALAGLSCLLLGIGLPLAIQSLSAGWAVFSWVGFHAERGINIDSLYGSILMAMRPFGLPVEVVSSHVAYDLESPLAPALKHVATLSLLGILAGAGWLALRTGRKYDAPAAYRTSLLVVVASVIASNVLSPQYMLWAIPLSLLVALEVLPSRVWPWVAMSVLLLAIAGLTTWLFPYHYLDKTGPICLVPNLAPLACSVLGLRNLAYLGLVVWLGAAVARHHLHDRCDSRPAGSLTVHGDCPPSAASEGLTDE